MSTTTTFSVSVNKLTNAIQDASEFGTVVQMDFHDDHILISGRSYEAGVITKIECECNCNLVVMFDPVKALKYLKLCDDSKVDIELVSETASEMFETTNVTSLRLSSNDGSIELCIENESPSSLPEPDGDGVEFDASFASAIGSVLYAIDTESSRYALGGVCIDEDVAVATDGRRLAVNKFNRSSGVDGVVVPEKACKWIASRLTGEGVTFYHCQHCFHVVCGNIRMYSLYIEGRYPNWRCVIPESNTRSLKVDREWMIRTAKVASISVDPESRGCKLSFDGNNLHFHSKNCGSKSNASMLATGEFLDGGCYLDVKYIRDALENYNAIEFSIETSDPDKPAVFRAGDYTAVVMPLSVERIAGESEGAE